MLETCKIVQPAWVCAENVTGILSMEDKSGNEYEIFPKVESRTIVRYDEVDCYEAVYTRQAHMLIHNICQDLEEAGFEVQPVVIPAASVGAPHRRDRVWIIGYSEKFRRKQPRSTRTRRAGFKNTDIASDTKSTRIQQEAGQGRKKQRQAREHLRSRDKSIDESGHATNAGRKRQEKRQKQPMGFEQLCKEQFTPNPKLDGQQRSREPKQLMREETHPKRKATWSEPDGKWPTQPPVRSGNDGIPERLDAITVPKWAKESLKALGNAIVPQVAYQIFQAIEKQQNS